MRIFRDLSIILMIVLTGKCNPIIFLMKSVCFTHIGGIINIVGELEAEITMTHPETLDCNIGVNIASYY